MKNFMKSKSISTIIDINPDLVKISSTGDTYVHPELYKLFLA